MPSHVLDLYVSKLPPEASILDIFSSVRLNKPPLDSSAPWYIGSQPVGKNTLDTKLRRVCSLAGIEGDFMNHSLRATSATQMFDMGVPEKVIQEQMGHKSLEALRTYERMNSRQLETVSHLLSNPIGRETTMNNIRVACQTSQSLNPRNCNIYFGNLQSCTINSILLLCLQTIVISH